MLGHDLEARLVELVRSTAWIMRILQAARTVDAPDWLVSAGAIRNLVWDHLHGFSKPTALKDVDLGFFDADHLHEEREAEVGNALRELAPGIPWDAKKLRSVRRPARGRGVQPRSAAARCRIRVKARAQHVVAQNQNRREDGQPKWPGDFVSCRRMSGSRADRTTGPVLLVQLGGLDDLPLDLAGRCPALHPRDEQLADRSPAAGGTPAARVRGAAWLHYPESRGVSERGRT